MKSAKPTKKREILIDQYHISFYSEGLTRQEVETIAEKFKDPSWLVDFIMNEFLPFQKKNFRVAIEP